MRTTVLGSLLMMLIGFSACGPDYVYQQTRMVNSDTWTYSDSLTYEFAIEDTLQIYNLAVRLKHAQDFRYQNLYTQIHTTFPNGERLTETLSLELASKAGAWLGECGSKTCQLDIPIQEGAYFNQAGTYHVTIEQFTRQDSLPGIEWITFSVEKTDDRRS